MFSFNVLITVPHWACSLVLLHVCTLILILILILIYTKYMKPLNVTYRKAMQHCVCSHGTVFTVNELLCTRRKSHYAQTVTIQLLQ